MNLFNQLIARMTDWLDALDRERDVAMRMMERRGRIDELAIWLDTLEAERVKHLELIAQLRLLDGAHHPALLFSERPMRMLKSSLPSTFKKAAS